MDTSILKEKLSISLAAREEELKMARGVLSRKKKALNPDKRVDYFETGKVATHFSGVHRRR